MISHVQLFATPWTAAYQAPPPIFSRQEYWSGVSPPPPKIKQEKDGGTHRSFCPANHPGRRVETYLGFQQVITGFMVWWLWSIVRASRSQWRTQSWRKMGSLQRQGAGAQGDPVRATFFTTVATETGLVLAPGWRAVARLWVCGTISCAQQ